MLSVNAGPNVLVFCVDEMRSDYMGCAGNPLIRTPNLDRLAARGTLFARSYCSNPICMPARASMFTGMLPRDHGLRITGQSLRRDIPTLPGILAGHGYRTHSAGKIHLTPFSPLVDARRLIDFPESRAFWEAGDNPVFPLPYYGFQSVDYVGGHTLNVYGRYIGWLRERGGDERLLREEKATRSTGKAPFCFRMAQPKELHYNRFIADSTIDFIKSKDPQPFFAWCSFPDPHFPIAPPEPFHGMYDPDTVELTPPVTAETADLPPFYSKMSTGQVKQNGLDTFTKSVSEPQVQEMIALTYGMISHMDEEIGRVLDAVAAAGLADNTLIVFLGDHGDMMGDRGFVGKSPFTFQACTRLPTIVAASALPGGQVTQSLIAQIDLLPSVLDYCGLPLPGSDWHELMPEVQFGQLDPLALYPGRSWIPVLRNPEQTIHEAVVIENDHPPTGFCIRCLVTDRYRLAIYPGTSDGELFDLVADPHELRNLWYDGRFASLRQELITELCAAYSRHTPFYPMPPARA